MSRNEIPGLASNAWRTDALWELFHENTKNASHPSLRPLLSSSGDLAPTLGFESLPEIALPPRSEEGAADGFSATGDAQGALSGCDISQAQLGALLGGCRPPLAAVETGDSEGEPSDLPTKAPLSSLELLVHSRYTLGVDAGVYYFDPRRHSLRLVRGNDHSHVLATSMVECRLAHDAAVLVIVVGIPERSVRRYGDRGYRLMLKELGSVIENLRHGSRALGLGFIDVTDFHERVLDEFLGFDGLNVSTLGLAAIGREAS